MPAYDETAGTLLLRNGWNGDAIVDLLGTNPRTSDRIQGVGIMLVAAAMQIASQFEANLVFVETARHSTSYWGEKFLKRGTELIRCDGSGVAFERAMAILKGGNVTYAESDDS